MVLESGFSCSESEGFFLEESKSRFGFGDFEVELQRTVNLLMDNLDDLVEEEDEP